MHSRILLIVIVLSGCQATPVVITANQSCDLAPNVWQQVATPTNREALLELPEPIMKKPVRQYFVATSTQKEAWFEDSNRDLQACLYNPLKHMSCYGGELHVVTFKRLESSWEAGPTVEKLCID